MNVYQSTQTAIASLLAVTLMVAPCAPLVAQTNVQERRIGPAINLPKLGDAGEEDFPLNVERKIGEEIFREYQSSGLLVDDPEVTDYLWQVASKLTKSVNANGYDFKFFVVRDPSINAFAMPGGYIGVHTGLLAAAQSESELASVLAHEIGHITQRHIARMLAQQKQTSVLSLAGLVLAVLAARNNPQAAFGALSLGSTLQTTSLLSFSRDAEREADRVGFDMLGQGGFDPAGMALFFTRLQQANRLNESRAPEYFRTHPLTQDRISDVQLRLQSTRYKQRTDPLDFFLVRSRLSAGLDGSVDGLARSRSRIEVALRDKTAGNELAAWFGLGHVALLQRDFASVDKALLEMRKRLASYGAAGGHPMIESLAIETKMQIADNAGALELAKAAQAKFVQSRAIGQIYAKALLATGQAELARVFLENQLSLFKTDLQSWSLLAKSYDALNQPVLAHRATAEQYALLGAWPAAIGQLELAQKTGSSDFYLSSQIDAKLREWRLFYQREQRERAGR